MLLQRRSFIAGLVTILAIPAIIRTPNLLMRIKPQQIARPSWPGLIGQIVPYVGEILPIGFEFAHGQSISRRENPELFARLGTRYGDGDGVTSFNLPDVRGMALQGVHFDDPSRYIICVNA